MLVYSIAHGRKLVLSLRKDFELGLFFKIYFLFVCMHIYISLCALCEYKSLWGPEEGARAPELELQGVVSYLTLVLETELGSSS